MLERVTESNLLAWEPDEEDRAFLDVYGPWDPLTPTQVSELMADYPAPWWIVGGWAVVAAGVAWLVLRQFDSADLVVPAPRTLAPSVVLGFLFSFILGITAVRHGSTARRTLA